MAPAPLRNIVLLVFAGCLVMIGLAAIGRESESASPVFIDAFEAEPNARLDHVQLCVRPEGRAWAVKWHPLDPLSERELEELSNRVWSRISAQPDAPHDPVILAMVEHVQLGPIEAGKRHRAIVYGGLVDSDAVSSCLDD